MRMYDIIEKTINGNALTKEELNYFITGMINSSIPDYQVSALLTAIFIKGMNKEETADLTLAMANSGDSLDLSSIKGIKMDKHSTGGVGDKTTLVVAPIVASCGVPVAKMSGRGLGHTGGTLDKLESIPGMKTEMTTEEFLAQVKKIGLAVVGQTENFDPADKIMYALRNSTATISSIPLIASSIMSKKLAAGANGIVLDVKTGSGAFMSRFEDSIELASAMVSIGERTGRKTVAYITSMDDPLGLAVGNSLEVIEAIETLKGRGPRDLQMLSLELAAKMVEMGTNYTHEESRELVKDAVYSMKALEKFREMIKRQGGNPEVIDNYDLFDQASIKYELIAETDGYIVSMDTNAVGTASMLLGAGRAIKSDPIDYSAGIILNKKARAKIEKGTLIATLHTNNEYKLKDALEVLNKAIVTSQTNSQMKPLILAYVDSKNVHRYSE
ncbi:MAG: thymidine phosphorylase [Eubacteriales bacterium]|nr:thymidine phosphorylase [Eubacteriales bacterium]